jgi:toxin ParE1/3/4
MELKIFWTEFSKNSLELVYKYYKKEAGVRIAKKIISDLFNEVQILRKQAKIGQIEELLIDREEEFRYLVFKNYKIIYWINHKKNQVEIVDVFDTRQNPVKLKSIR